MVVNYDARSRSRGFRRRDRRTQPVGGRMVRPRRDLSFRSRPARLEDLDPAAHRLCGTVVRPPLRLEGGRFYTILYRNPPRRDRRGKLVPRRRGPSHRPRAV